MNRFDFNSAFPKDRERLLAPLLTPEHYKARLPINFGSMVGLMLLPPIVFLWAYSYFVLGIKYVPWWVFLVLGGGVAPTLLIDDEEWEPSEEIDALRQSEPELYAEIDHDIEMLLEGRTA